MRKAHHLWFATAGLVATAGGVLLLTEALPATAETAARLSRSVDELHGPAVTGGG